MISRNLSTFLRSLGRNKSLTAINLIGLALGFSCCILITLFLFDELAYDSHHDNLKRIYRINTRFVSEGSVDHVAISASPLPDVLTRNYPEVEACVRFDHKGMGVVVRNQSQVFRDKDAYAADASVFRMFSYKFLQGDPVSALLGPDKVVLTRSAAMKYFGQTHVVGSTLEIDKTPHVVTAVVEDVPANSEIKFSMLMSLADASESPDWFDFSYYVFVMFRQESLDEPGFLSVFEQKLQAIADENINAVMKKENVEVSASMHIQPLEGLHFDNTLMYDTPKGNKMYVYIFACVAVLVLFIACINYINFSIVQSMEKSREAGIRKVVGSTFYQLVARYITQSFLLTLLGATSAVTLVYVLLPYFNGIVERNFTLHDLFQPQIMLTVITIVFITGVLAGSYPAFYASSVKIVDVLKGHVSSPGGKTIRRISLTVQFALSLGLIISTLVIYGQIDFVRNYDLGFRKDNIIAITTPEDSTSYYAIQSFKQDLLANNHLIKNVTLVGDGAMPGDPEDEQRGSLTLINGKGEQEVRMINHTYIDENYFSVLGIKPKIGRAYEEGNISDQHNAVIVNEALVQALGWKDPLSQTITLGEREKRIIGVVGNIHYKSLYNPVQPQVFRPQEHRIVHVLAALTPDANDEINFIQSIWQKYFPGEPFVYRYLNETLHHQYKREQVVAKISTYFSVLTIVISILGIFGLSLLSAYQRRKEIGIRKIVGANFNDITKLFFNEYLPLLILALIVISPITWYIMQRWLQMFVSYTPLRVTMFVLVGCAFSALSLVTIIFSLRKVSKTKSCDLIKSSL